MLSAEEVKGIYCDSYRLYVKYHGQPSSKAMWNTFVVEHKQLLTKYHNSSLCLRHLTGVQEQLEKEQGYLYEVDDIKKA